MIRLIKISAIFPLLLLLSTLYSCFDSRFSAPTPAVYLINGPEDLFPSFSADGNYIAYSHLGDTTKNYPPGLYVIDRNGRNRKLVLLGTHIDPAWSPDGKWLVFSSHGSLQKCKINGDSLTTFSGLDNKLKYPDFYFPDCTKNGKYIYFNNPYPSDGGGIYRINWDFSMPTLIMGLDSASSAIGIDPGVSNDLKKLTFYSGRKGYDYTDIFVSNILGGDKIKLTNNGRDNIGPCWAPDGKRIVWSSDVRLSIMNSDGSNQKIISYGNSPSWSINDQIVFSHANNNYTKEVLYTISPDGSNRKQITF